MNIKLLSNSELLAKIAKVEEFYKNTTAAFMSGGLVHETACECLLHAQKHGDVGPSQRLYLALGGALDTNGRQVASKSNIIKAESVKAWFVRMSGNQYTARNGTWGLKDKWKPDLFLLDEAEQTPIQAFAPAERVVSFSAESILNRIDGFVERIKNDFSRNEEGKPYFVGDYEKTLAVAQDIRDYAHKRIEAENMRDMGMATEGNVIQLPTTEQKSEGETKLIRDGEEVVNEGQERQAAAG